MFGDKDSQGKPQGNAERAAILARAFSDAQTLLHQCLSEHRESALQHTLEMVGKAMGADRAYIFRIRDALTVDNIHEWCADGVRPLKAELQYLPYEMGDPFWQAFRATRQSFKLSTCLVRPDSAFRLLLESHEIKSLIASPLWCDGDITGLVGLDFVREDRAFTDLEDALMLSFASSVGLVTNLQHQSGELQRVQSELRLERARVDAMVSTLPELLVETDHSGIIVAFKQSDPLVFALNPQEVIGHPPEIVLPPVVAAIVRKAMKQVDLVGWSPSFAYTLPFPAGDKRFTLTATRRHHDDPLVPHGYLFIVRDVTESYSQDKQIRQLGRVAELSTNLIMLTDRNRHVTWMNPACVARTGYTMKTAHGRKPSEVLHLRDAAPDMVPRFCEALDDGHSINAEVRARSRRGISYWLDLNIQPLRSPDGYIQGYMVVGVDITSHKLTEARALRDKIQAMEITREGIAILDPDGRFLYLNAAFRTIAGLRGGVDASTLTWHELVAPEHTGKLEDIFSKLMAEGYWTGEVLLSDEDGQDAWYDLSLSVQDDGSIFVLVRNTTARRLAEADRERLREQLQIAQSRQLMSQLAGGLAHDFANILAAIVGSVDMLKPKASPDSLPGLDRIHAAGRQGQALVRNLLRLGRMKSAASTSDLQDVLHQSVELVRPGLAKEIPIVLDFDGKRATTEVDATEMMQVIVNLLMNGADAIRATGRPDGRLKVSMTAQDQISPLPEMDIGKLYPGRSYAIISISDNGAGMDETVRSEIFKPYFTTKGKEGTGLGLAIVAHVVTIRHWGLQVLAGTGGGTDMRLYLPVGAPHSGTVIESQSPDAHPLDGRNVLLVHADDSILQSMAGTLSAAGAEVASCTDPGDAIDAIREDPQTWDTVVISDELAHMTGLALARDLQALNRNLRIIVTTASQQLRFANEIDKQLVTAVLPIPVSSAELITTLAHIRLT
ncbi:PAS domain-containing protein [Roseinatronobacter sp.]|uniref:PAS domain-containing protein n=1 Tax=Roseinatronobacter sp. TaxID=1945755 RepID=UPI003F70EB22